VSYNTNSPAFLCSSEATIIVDQILSYGVWGHVYSKWGTFNKAYVHLRAEELAKLSVGQRYQVRIVRTAPQVVDGKKIACFSSSLDDYSECDQADQVEADLITTEPPPTTPNPILTHQTNLTDLDGKSVRGFGLGF
jgi:hypothetical protein